MYNKGGKDYRFYLSNSDMYVFRQKVLELPAYATVEIDKETWKRLLHCSGIRTLLSRERLGVITKDPEIIKVVKRF